jgi:UDP:flavonoid glycosyltransferase YjiC (YdhE family)
MRILVTTSPLMGHLRPMLPLLRAAGAAGHEVVVATGPDLARELQRRGYQTWSVGPAAAAVHAVRAAQPSAADPAGHLRRSASTMFGQPGAARARDLLPRASRWQPDLVVHEITEVAGAEVAALTGAREIVVGPTGDVAPAEALLPVVTAELAATLRTPDRHRDLLAATFLDPRVPALAADRPTTFADVRPLRPELDEPQTRLPLRAQRFGGETTVLLSLGRHGVRGDTLLGALDGLRGFGINVLVETGSDLDLTQLGQPPRNVAVAPVIDYARALPLCSAVIANGAAELTAGALAHGLPLVTLPRTPEQLATARALHTLGAGRTVQPDQLRPGAVRRALADVIADPVYARAARRQQTAIAALPSAADLLADLTLPVAA